MRAQHAALLRIRPTAEGTAACQHSRPARPASKRQRTHAATHQRRLAGRAVTPQQVGTRCGASPGVLSPTSSPIPHGTTSRSASPGVLSPTTRQHIGAARRGRRNHCRPERRAALTGRPVPHDAVDLGQQLGLHLGALRHAEQRPCEHRRGRLVAAPRDVAHSRRARAWCATRSRGGAKAREGGRRRRPRRRGGRSGRRSLPWASPGDQHGLRRAIRRAWQEGRWERGVRAPSWITSMA